MLRKLRTLSQIEEAVPVENVPKETPKEKVPPYNFKVIVKSVINMYHGVDADAKPIPHAVIKMDFEDGNPPSEEFTHPIASLDAINWFSKDLRCRFDPGVSESVVKRYLSDDIRAELPKLEPKKRYSIDQTGTFVIEGEPMLCTGRTEDTDGGLLRPHAGPDAPDIVLTSIPDKLDIDNNLSEAEVIAWMFELISLSPDSIRVILAQNLLYIKRAAYELAWKSPCVSVLLHGPLNTQKTTIALFLSQQHNRSKGIMKPDRLRASVPAAVGILKAHHDSVAVLDDLFPSDFKNVRGQQEETMSEVTRFIGDGTLPARMKGNEVVRATTTCGALFTSEYVIDTNPSTATRFLCVEHSKPDGTKLKNFQDQPLVVSTFYYFYAKWYISNFFEIQDALKEWRNVYSDVRLGVRDRLQETHYFLNTAHVMLLQYCYDKDFLSQHDAEKLHSSFCSLLTGLVRAQDTRANQGNSGAASAIDYLPQLREMFKNNTFIIADCANLFCDNLHDGVIHGGCLCLRRKQLSKHFPDTFLDDVIASLDAQGALRKTPGGGRQIQIYARGGKRFYAIPLEKLQ